MALAGCQSPAVAPTDPREDPTQPTVIWADWDDIDAAILGGLPESETVVTNTDRADDRRAFHLLSIDGREGKLVITRDPTARPDAKGSEQLSIAAGIDGPLGPDQARRAKRGVTKRLQELAGVDWAPVK